MEITEFYRCLACHKAVEMVEWLKKNRASCSCGAKRFSPTRLTWWEVAKYLVTHPRTLWDTYVRN